MITIAVVLRVIGCFEFANYLVRFHVKNNVFIWQIRDFVDYSVLGNEVVSKVVTVSRCLILTVREGCCEVYM